MEYLAKFRFILSDFSLSPQLTYDFLNKLQNKLYYIFMHALSVFIVNNEKKEGFYVLDCSPNISSIKQISQSFSRSSGGRLAKEYMFLRRTF